MQQAFTLVIKQRLSQWISLKTKTSNKQLAICVNEYCKVDIVITFHFKFSQVHNTDGCCGYLPRHRVRRFTGIQGQEEGRYELLLQTECNQR
jgi:hypothetical protein